MYSARMHRVALRRALQLLHGWARGPAREMAAKKLMASCDSLWSAGGRRRCEAVSVTGRPCVLKAGHAEIHRGESAFLRAVASGSIQRVGHDTFALVTHTTARMPSFS